MKVLKVVLLVYSTCWHQQRAFVWLQFLKYCILENVLIITKAFTCTICRSIIKLWLHLNTSYSKKSVSLQILTLLGRPHLVVDLICFGKNITQLKKHLTSEFGGYQPSVEMGSSQTRLKENSGLVVCLLWTGLTPPYWCIPISEIAKNFDLLQSFFVQKSFLSDPSPIIGYACH